MAKFPVCFICFDATEPYEETEECRGCKTCYHKQCLRYWVNAKGLSGSQLPCCRRVVEEEQAPNVEGQGNQ